MKITALHLKSFRSAVGLTVPTDAARILIAGKNHVGKSSVREAIRWGLTGRSTVTDAKGSGAEKLIPTDEKEASLVLEVDGLGGVSRSYGPGVKAFAVSGFTGEPSVQQQALYDKLGTSPAYLDAVLDSGLFLSLHHAEAKALVLSLLDVRFPVDGQDRTLDELDDLYKQAFDDRKVAKVRARQYTVPAMPAGDPPPTVEAIEGQLVKLRQMLEDLSGSAGQHAGKREALAAQIAKLTTMKPFVGSLPYDEVVRQIEVLETEIAGLEAALEETVAPAKPAEGDTVAQMKFLRSTVEALREHQPKKGCVLDGDVPCETAKVKFTLRAKALQETLSALESGAEVAGAVPAMPVAESPLKAARRRLNSLVVLRGQYDQSAIQERDRAEEIARLTAELAALPDTTANANDTAVLKGRIQKGEALLGTSRTYWTAVYQHQEGQKKEKALADEVARLETRCDLLGPNGIRVDALREAVGGFEARINACTALFGWTVAFHVDPWRVDVNGRPVETYSESEQFLIGIAVQLAIAEVSGLSFAVVDRLDMLDIEHRAKATGMLMRATLDQVFILATREDAQALPSNATLIAHRFALVNGRTKILESTGL